jgi:hypothetical protein
MAETTIVQIRKKGGLDGIVKEKNSKVTVKPMLYHTKTKNRNEEGTLTGDYKGKTILDTKHFIAPMWNDLKSRWSFDSNVQKLTELIQKMKLRYPKNHPRDGEVIKPSAEDGDRITNRHDDVFNHPDFYGKYYMENGRISLDLSDPKQDFLFLCYKGDSLVDDKSQDGNVSKYISSGAKYELISPKKEIQKLKKDADKDVRAIKLLAGLDQDIDRMRAICTIMALPQYAPTTDGSGLFVLLKDMAAENRSFSPKYNKTYQDRFIALAELSDDELNINSRVIQGRNQGHLRKRTGFYLFNGEKLDGIDNDLQLVNYFRKPGNQEDYVKLLDLLDNGGKQ